MKRNSLRNRESGKKRKEFYDNMGVFEVRRIWASSECLDPYNDAHVYGQVKNFLTKGASI